MADTKVSALTDDTDPQPADLLYTVDDPAGTPLSKKATVQNVLKSVDNLSADASPLAADLLMTIDDPGGTPVPKKALLSNIVGYVVTTAGDIIFATASRTLARLGIGTLGQVLKVNSGATAPEWGDTGNILQGNVGGFDPADATTYYLGNSQRATASAHATAQLGKVHIPLAGTIVAIYVTFDQTGTTGTTETSTASIRLNQTSDTTISAVVQNDANIEVFSNTGLSITVVAGDYIEVKWVTPTWVTNPTAVFVHWEALIRPS